MKIGTTNIFNTIAAIGILTSSFPVWAITPNDSPAHRWQMNALLQPSNTQLRSESRGRIVIYANLPDHVVERAMDLYFDRIESMMFASIIVTDADGEPVIDSKTGKLITKDDGC